MADLVYWLWQSFHLRDGVAYEISGTLTSRNIPPSRDALKTDPVDLDGGLLEAETRPISDMLDKAVHRSATTSKAALRGWGHPNGQASHHRLDVKSGGVVKIDGE